MTTQEKEKCGNNDKEFYNAYEVVLEVWRNIGGS
jgi:hypothetical protein